MEKGSTLGLYQSFDVFKDILPEIKQACLANIEQIIKDNPKPKLTNDSDLNWIKEEVHILRVTALIESYKRTIKAITSLEQQQKNPNIGKITNLDIEKAREYPISELYQGRLFKYKTGLCPFHQEQTPSFHIAKNNRFKCFGCGESGDSITFVMKDQNLNFIQAVKKLI